MFTLNSSFADENVEHNSTEETSIEQTVVVTSDVKSSNETLEKAPDSAKPDLGQSLADLPGAYFNQNGVVSVLPQYRGHIGTRTSVILDGFGTVSAGPNLMDAPLSYASTGWVDNLVLYRGIAPVAAAFESIGSVIEVETTRPEFNQESYGLTQGSLSLAGNSNGHAQDMALDFGWANHMHRMQLLASSQISDDVNTPIGTIFGSEYDKRVQQFYYGANFENQAFDISHQIQNVGLSGTPALPMDISFIDSIRTTVSYATEVGGYRINLGGFSMDSDHKMDNYSLRPAMMTRETFASGEGDGVNLDFSWRYQNWNLLAGLLKRTQEHSATINDPSNPMFRVVNFNQSSREDVSAYLQANRLLFDAKNLTFGIRYKSSKTNSAEVSHHMYGASNPIRTVQDRFNQMDRNRAFSSYDLTLNYSIPLSQELSWEFGIGQKSRAPVYQELYLWVPMQATGGLADGNVYVGNLELDSEVATQFEVGLMRQNEKLRFAPRLYYQKLHDYIQGVQTNDPALLMIANMMGTSEVFQFQNVDGRIYGFDADLLWSLSDNWEMSAVMSVIRAERDDLDEPLYRIVPDNIQWTWTYWEDEWQVSTELQAFASQNRVAKSLNETSSGGYGLINLAGQWSLTNDVKIQFGIDNLLDKYYASHTAGVNRTMMNLVPVGDRLPGLGRSLYLSTTIEL